MMRNASLRTQIIALCGALAFAVLATGCNRTGGGATLYCANFISKLRGCGLLSEGDPPSCTEPGPDPTGRCFINCLLSSSCDQLEEAYCVSFEPLLARCMESCQPAEETFTCGDGTTYPASIVCDGFELCTDGSDEAGCPTFTCGDGSTILASQECDGFSQCPDSSDEVSCPTFACADGGAIPADQECDGFVQCVDQSDELGCPGVICVTVGGRAIDETSRCDGFDDCDDGADEMGCPIFTCGDGSTLPRTSRCNMDPECADGSDETGCAMLTCGG